MSTLNTDLAQIYADGLAGTLASVWEAVENDEQYEDQDAREYLDEMPLEIVDRKHTAFAVVLTLGGPTAEIVYDSREGEYALVVSWHSEPVRRYSAAISSVGAYFYDLVAGE